MSIDNPQNPQTPEAQTAQYRSPEPPRRNRTPLIAISIAVAAVVGIGGLGTAGVALLTRPSTSETAMQNAHARSPLGFYNQGLSQGEQQIQGGSSADGSTGDGSVESAAVPATAAQKVGVVTIKTDLDFGNGAAAGTGMILSSNGLILTNNHVVQQSTAIKVTIESTGKTYTAKVVGTDQKKDVAVLQLVGASGLTPVTFAADETVAVGQTIHSVGNAEGTGDLVTASGKVGGVNKSLQIQSDFSTGSENLSGLIELDSDVVSGDSGGPLFDSSGKVIGIVTAASSGSADVTGYAINIAAVLDVVKQIEQGSPTSEIVIGTPAFLGIELSDTQASSGVVVSGTFPGMPAEKAGITSGSEITSFDGTSVTSATQLSALVAKHAVGDQVTVHWTTSSGSDRSAVVTLTGGPAA
jgi:S1-C subfamily serine protease